MGAEIEVGEAPPEDGGPEGAPGTGEGAGGVVGLTKRTVSWPMDRFQQAVRRVKGMNRRDQLVIVLGLLAIVALLIAWAAGGGGRGDGDGATIVTNWNWMAGEQGTAGNTSSNTNLEAHASPYLERFEPEPGQVFFISELHAHVEWTDESSPPTQVPAAGYVNDPDAFQLRIDLVSAGEIIESELVYNQRGQSGSIDLDINFTEPILVANTEGAKYLPEGYNETYRIDFIVYTEDCGDWHNPTFPRLPTVGDGGNGFTFTWSVVYYVDSTREKP